MATMHPSALPAAILENPKLKGEVKVYNQLAQDKKLNAAFEVFYNCVVDGVVFAYERPIDFVILHDQYGALCIEVKGGNNKITEDGTYLQSRRGRNDFKEIKPPHVQAKMAARAFVAGLKKHVDFFIPVSCCVFFPFEFRSDFEKNNPKPDYATLFQSDYLNLEEKIIAMMPPIKVGFKSAWGVKNAVARIKPHLKCNRS